MKKILKFWLPVLSIVLIGGCGQKAKTVDYIGIDAAKNVALKNAGVVETDAVFSTTGLDKRDGKEYYAIDFSVGGQKYEYDIDAVTGEILKTETKATASENPAPEESLVTDADTFSNGTETVAPATPSTQNTDSITEDAARATALNHAGVSDAVFSKFKIEWENGRQIYEMEFYADGNEYDYEIDIATGAIVSHKCQSAPSPGITAEEAKSIALSQISGASESNIYEFEIDSDDGQIKYEGKIYYNSMEYEFEIDGQTGKIIDWEAERMPQ
ncbi:MAG: hypothetical protein HFE62_02930 [Firmicutes bacterium]|nr:hypothetical protein [Bacillota bacterium]